MGRPPELCRDSKEFKRRIEAYIEQLRKEGVIKPYDSMHERAVFFSQLQRWYHWMETGKDWLEEE